MPRKARPLKERLLELATVNQATGCWEIRVRLNRMGRPRIAYEGKRQMASRLSYLAFKGERVPDDKVVCHTCDNGVCVNPDHLFIGSQLENVEDSIKKKRYRLNAWTGDRCSKGHALTPSNIVTYVGPDGFKRRRCKECAALAGRRSYARNYARPRLNVTTAPDSVRRAFEKSGKTHCMRGHEFSAENTKWRKEGPYWKRSCKQCTADRAALAYRRKHGLSEDFATMNRYRYPKNSAVKAIARGPKHPPESEILRLSQLPRRTCKKGHRFTPENTAFKYTKEWGWGRVCRKCRAAYMRDYLQRRNSRSKGVT